MKIQPNPALEAYLKAKDSGLYSEDELTELLKSLELNLNDLPSVQFMEDAEGKPPVTTLKTIEDEEFSLEAPGGPIQTTKQRLAAKEFAQQVELKQNQKSGENKS